MRLDGMHSQQAVSQPFSLEAYGTDSLAPETDHSSRQSVRWYTRQVARFLLQSGVTGGGLA